MAQTHTLFLSHYNVRSWWRSLMNQSSNTTLLWLCCSKRTCIISARTWMSVLLPEKCPRVAWAGLTGCAFPTSVASTCQCEIEGLRSRKGGQSQLGSKTRIYWRGFRLKKRKGNQEKNGTEKGNYKNGGKKKSRDAHCRFSITLVQNGSPLHWVALQTRERQCPMQYRPGLVPHRGKFNWKR